MKYNDKNFNVSLVPTDDVSQGKLDTIIAKTQAVYDRVGIKIHFRKEQKINIDDVVAGNIIPTEKNTFASTYSKEQQKIND